MQGPPQLISPKKKQIANLSSVVMSREKDLFEYYCRNNTGNIPTILTGENIIEHYEILIK